MRIRDVTAHLDRIAPVAWAEQWDSVGLLLGDPDEAVRGLLLCIDLTEAVVAEAVAAGAGMVMAYHPAIFKPIARLTGGPVLAAARAGLAVYAMHTALDAAPGGTSDVLADAMGLGPRKPIEPTRRPGDVKIVTFVPPEACDSVAEAAFAAGAGQIGRYSRCGFAREGVGSFLGQEGTHPAIGQPGRPERVREVRWETVAPEALAGAVAGAIRRAHPYEEPPVDICRMIQAPSGVGMGRIGPLGTPSTLDGLVQRLQRACGLAHVQVVRAPRHAPDRTDSEAHIHQGACCPGSAGALALAARAMGAEVYVTGELRHHDALAARAAGLSCICLGHWHSERIALGVLAEHLASALDDVAIHLSSADRDPLETL